MRQPGPAVSLRPVRSEDLPTFHGHRGDEIAAAMAAMPVLDPAEAAASWKRMTTDPGAQNRTVVVDGLTAGYVAVWGPPEKRNLGYWIGREFWGRGVASTAVALFLAEVPERPLHAVVARANGGSQRVLEKCGFIITGSAVAGDGVTEITLNRLA